MKVGRILLWIFIVLLVGGTVAGIVLMTRNSEGDVNWKTYYEQEPQSDSAVTEAPQTEMVTEKAGNVGEVIKPEIKKELLTVNKWSRSGDKMQKVNYLVIHYMGNAGTTAQQTRDYFEGLKDTKEASVSAHYVVGLDGEVIQCVPDDEIAYASNVANKESISIQNCNIDESGKLLKDTYISLVKLTAYLADQYDLSRDQIIRHYDVTGKECPVYYVEHEDAWETFLDDVMLYRQMCEEKSPNLEVLEEALQGVKNTFESRFDKDISVDDASKEGLVAGRPHDYQSANEGFEGTTQETTEKTTEKKQEETASTESTHESSDTSSNSDSSNASRDDVYSEESYDDNNSYDDGSQYTDNQTTYDQGTNDQYTDQGQNTDQGQDTATDNTATDDSTTTDPGTTDDSASEGFVDDGTIVIDADNSSQAAVNTESSSEEADAASSSDDGAFIYVDEDNGGQASSI